MRIGLLWFDNDKNVPLKQKLTDAARRYRERFGHQPTTCYVSPKDEIAEAQVNGMAIQPLHTVQPGHFWLCVEEAATLSTAA